jgi:serine/threonine protein kinase/DNA-binding winged helix-turn-helix (wHTH) protein/tetratricopeptide (TPR) repeat protein
MEDRYLDRAYTIAGRVIDPIGGTVAHVDQRIPLKRKHLEVLACLASAGTAVVAREAFIDLVWRGNALVGDNGLNSSIHALRRALQDTDADKPLIKTIPRRGYQLTVVAGEAQEALPEAFAPGMPIAGKPGWHLSRKLGGNAASELWLAQDRTSGDKRAFRFCRSEQHLQALRRETTVLRYLREALAGRQDTAVVLDWQLDEPPYHLEMDDASGGSLAEWAVAQGGIGRMAYPERLRLTGEVAEALAAVHAVDVVHRNLVPSSVLMHLDRDEREQHARLGEFGLSDLTDRSRLEALQITSAGLTLTGDQVCDARYLAPERLAGQTATAASDVYALGVLLLQMAVGDLQRTPADAWEQEIDSHPLRELIAACTSAAPEARPEAAVVAEWLRAFAQAAHDAKRTDATASHVARSPLPVAAQTPEAPAPTAPASTASEPTTSDPAIGGRVGPYRLLDQLGEGGMGVVYLAEQLEPVQRKVALKLIKTGMDSKQVLARFEAERQALALMNHANVATVYEAGSTSLGQPYFAMEYVRGLDITAHCDQLEMDFRERIALFLQACEGVLHAHQKGLIHRDLKPGNILVSRAQDQPATVKIIDFGVSKSLLGVLGVDPAYTRLGSFVGTPAYSSPEQVSGPLVNVDTRTDIYSLGVVLYQLLAGVTPYSEEELNRKTPIELARLLSGERPPSLLARFSSLSVEDEGKIARHRSLSVEQMKALLGSDLSWIVGKCLQSDPDDRYPSVLELEKDLRRWLDDKPIEARPASRMYRVRKFVRRHRVGVALASAMTLALLTATTAAVIGFVRTEEALKAARMATAEAEIAANFQVKQMQSINPAAIGLSWRSALIKAVQEQDPERGGDPATAAQRRQQQENLLKGVNFTDLALDQLDTHSFQPALATIKNDFRDSPLLQARLWQTMADTLFKLGQYEAAVEPQRLALEQRRRLLGADDPSTLVALYRRGALGCEMTRYKEAEVDLRAATTGLRRVFGNDHPDTLRSITATGYCLMYQGKFEMAVALFREAYERRRRTLGQDHRDTLVSANDLAAALASFGKFKEALPYAEASVNGFRRVQGSVLASRDHDMLKAVETLSSTYRKLGRDVESEALSREAIEVARQLLGDAHPDTSGLIDDLASALMGLDRPAEAEVYFRQALESRRAVLGDENEDVLFNRAYIANALAEQEKNEEAERILRDVIADHRRLFGEGHTNTSDLTNYLAFVLRDQGKLDESEALFTEVLTTRRRFYGNENRYSLQTMNALVSVLRKKGEISKAKALLQDALKIQRRTLGEVDQDTLESLRHLAAMTRAEGDLTLTETLMREALAGYRQTLGDDHATTLATVERLSQVLRERGAPDEAAALERAFAKSGKPTPNAKKQ